MSTAPSPKPTSRLELQVCTNESETVVKCSGKLTAEYSARFKEQVKGLIAHKKRLVLDLTDLLYMDSSGLGAAVSIYVSCKTAGCELRMINFNQRVRELLGLTHLLDGFEACGQYGIRMP